MASNVGNSSGYYDRVGEFVRRLSPKGEGLRVGFVGALGSGDAGDEAMLVAQLDRIKQIRADFQPVIFSMNAKNTASYLECICQETLHHYVYRSNRVYRLLLGMGFIFDQVVGTMLNRGLRIGRVCCYGWVSRVLVLARLVPVILFAGGGRLFCLLNMVARANVNSIARLDCLINIGGGYYNSWHVNERFYPYWAMLKIARKMGVPIIVSGLNIGPLNPFDRWILGGVLRQAELVGVRDRNESFEELRQMGVEENRCYYSSDDAWTLPAYVVSRDEKRMAKFENEGKYVVLNVHRWRASGVTVRRVVEECAHVSNYLISRYGMRVAFISMCYHPSDSDGALARRVAARCGVSAKVHVFPCGLQPQTLKHIVARSVLCITTRHHPFVFAISSGVPAVAISYDRYYNQKFAGVSFDAKSKNVVFQIEDLEKMKSVVDIFLRA